MKFTITDFRKTYPNDSVCLDKIFQLRYGHLTQCPECGKPAKFRRISTRRSYQCRHCYSQLYPTVNTVFEKTTTPLSYWFYAIYLMTATRNGVSAKELERQLGVTYKTAFRMAHKIRELFSKSTSEILSGCVEIDESYCGGKARNKHKSERKKLRGRGYIDKSMVFAILQRGGDVWTKMVDKVDGEYLKPIIRNKVDKNATVITDGFGAYYGLDKEYHHEIINHNQDEWYRNGYHTNTIEGYFSQLKRMIIGTHIHVSEKYLKNYVDEASFRYNNRKSVLPMFEITLSHLIPHLENT